MPINIPNAWVSVQRPPVEGSPPHLCFRVGDKAFHTPITQEQADEIAAVLEVKW